MNTRERLHTDCGRLAPRGEKSPEQEILEEKAGILSCGGVYLPAASAPAPKKASYQFLFLPNFCKEVKTYKNLDLIGSAPQQGALVHENPPIETGTSHEAFRKMFREGLN